MSEHFRPAVVPPVSLPARGELAALQHASGPLAARPPLPLLKLAEKRAGSAIYGMSKLGVGGRIADRSLVAELGWDAGQRLDLRVTGGLIAITADVRGVFQLTSQRFLHLPVAARRWCALVQGDRVLLAGYPQGGVLLVHPPKILDAIVDRVLAEALGAGDE